MTESNDSKHSGADQEPDLGNEADSAVHKNAESTPEAAPEPAAGSDEAGSDTADADHASLDEKETGRRQTADAPPARRGGRGVAWFALLLALAALALATMPFWAPSEEPEAPANDPRLDEFRAEIDALRQRLGEAEQSDPAVDELRQSLNARMDSLEAGTESLRDSADQPDPALRRLESRIEQIAGDTNATVEALRARIAEAEGEIESRLAGFEQGLDGLEGDVRQTAARLSERLRLLRIEALLATGADRMLLFGDHAGAERAWDAALSQAESLDGSRYQQLRERIAEDLTQLRSVGRQADPSARASSLLTAAGTVSNWPLKADAAAQADQSETAPEGGAEEAGWRQRLGGLMDRLVVVERTDDVFLDPSERERARERAEALMEALALTLLQGEYGRAEMLAGELDRHIRAVFVADDPAVAEVLDDLDLSAFGEAPVLDPEAVLNEARRLAAGLR